MGTFLCLKAPGLMQVPQLSDQGLEHWRTFLSILDADIVFFLSGVLGFCIALALDWAIFTHLEAYLRFVRLSPKCTWVQLTKSPLQKLRVMLVGICGGLATSALYFKYPLVWILSLIFFTIFHLTLYFSDREN